MDFSKINLDKKGINAVVSELEADILKVLWDQKKANSKTVLGKLRRKHEIASSTVSVYLDRLYSKGLVERETEAGKGGLHYIYSPKFSKAELGNKVADGFVSFLKKSFGESSTAYLRKRLK